MTANKEYCTIVTIQANVFYKFHIHFSVLTLLRFGYDNQESGA